MASADRVKFSRSHKVLTVKTFIGGKKNVRRATMVFDTGAFMTLITPNAAKILGYSESDSIGAPIKVSSPIGVEKGYRIQVKRIQIGRI